MPPATGKRMLIFRSSSLLIFLLKWSLGLEITIKQMTLYFLILVQLGQILLHNGKLSQHLKEKSTSHMMYFPTCPFALISSSQSSSMALTMQ